MDFQLNRDSLKSTLEQYEQLARKLTFYKEEQQTILDSVQNWDSETSKSFRESYSGMLSEPYSVLEEKCRKMTEILSTALEETNRLLNRRDGLAETLKWQMTAGVADILTDIPFYSTVRESGGILKLNDSLRAEVAASCDTALELVDRELSELQRIKEILGKTGNGDFDFGEDLQQLEFYIGKQKCIEEFKNSFESYCDGVEVLDEYLSIQFSTFTEEYGQGLDVGSYQEIRDKGLDKKVQKMVKAYTNILVTREQLEVFGWKELTPAKVKKLNYALNMYDITRPDSIALFLATCAAESGYGEAVLEQGSDAYFESKDYDKEERGVGYIQLTHRDAHLAFLLYQGDLYSGKETAEHISQNYDPWEVSAYSWSLKKFGGNFLNDYVSEHGGSLEVFLITQYYVNAFPEGRDKILRKIRTGEINYSINIEKNELIPQNAEKGFPLPKHWKEREEAYHKAIEIFS